tara:strand:+ start:1397 stop:2317 length:921 start_codon:yes stop_codon:yes gene_type:complete
MNLKNNTTGIILFGEHQIIEQWQALTQGYSNFSVCRNDKELSKFNANEHIVIYFNTNTRRAIQTAFKIKRKGFKIIKFWTGTDVSNLNDLSFLKKTFSIFFLKRLIKLHLTNSSWLTDELKELSITSQHWISPTPLYFDAKNTSHNELAAKEKIVLIYSNEGREWLYNAELMLKIAKLTPQLKFIFIGNNALKIIDLPNAQSLGVVNQDKMVELYKKSHILLRITEHDGFPRMIIEALYFGLNVIFNNIIPHTILSTKNTTEIIEKLLSKEVEAVNFLGRDYALKTFSAEQWVSQIQQYSTQLIKR